MFYRIRSGNKRGALVIESKIKYRSWEIFKDPAILIKDNFFKVDKGKKAYDLIEYCDPINFAISEKLKRVLEENKITGWYCYPIFIDGIDDKYYGFHIEGKGGEVTNRDGDGDVPMFEPVQFNCSNWDGSDIFYLKGTGIKVCTQKVKDLLEKEKITNIDIKLL